MTCLRQTCRLVALWVLMLAPVTFAQTNDHVHDLLEEIDHAPVTRPPVTRPAANPADPAINGSWPLFRFFLPVLAVTTATGLCGATLGTFVLRRGEALLALALPQAVAVGAAVGMRMGWPELPPALGAVVVGLMVFASDQRVTFGRAKRSTIIPAVYIGALCLSFLIIAHGGQHVEELQNLFTGVDVAVTPEQAAMVVPVLVMLGLIIAQLWRRWLLLAQMPAAAELAGISVRRWNTAFLFALAVYVLLGTAVQGVVMVLAMLFLPAAIVGPWARRLPGAIASAAVVATGMVGVAFVASNAFSWPLSHSVGGMGLMLLAMSQGVAFAVFRRAGGPA